MKFTPHARPAEAKADGGFTDTVVALLKQSSKPVALVGAGAKLSGAIADLRRLLDKSEHSHIRDCPRTGRC